jgi:penicillin G amidase
MAAGEVPVKFRYNSVVSLSRLLNYINLMIGLALVAVLAAGYWFAWRPLPVTSGTISAPIEREATVTRDSLGVPHIVAASIEDALFLQGFVTAQDRLWQMDGIRRHAAGEMAEVVGPAGLESDRTARSLRLRRIAEQHYAACNPQDRVWLAAYARGVNYAMENQRGRYPLEFSLLGYDPRPWSVIDTILASLELARDMTDTWRREIDKSMLMASGDREKVEMLYPVRAGGEPLPGSNAWVLSGARTATGRPILANDPHLSFSIPSPWHMVHLKAPGLNVTGVTMPGMPGVLIGHNDRIAWGITNLGFDVQDLYQEKLDPRSGRYLYRGHEEQARIERDLVRVKGGKAQEMATLVTRHGPVILSERGQLLTLRWTAAEAGGFDFPVLDLDRARNWQQFNQALARLSAPAMNFLYADADGNTGYRVAGRLPIRKNYHGDVPVDGASGDFEWDGYIPFEALPAVLNPPSGMIVNSNQNPFPENYSYRVAGYFDAPYRSRQIRDRLIARGGWKPEEMLGIQTDVYSAFSYFLARQVVAAYDARGRGDARLAEPVRLLRAWNGQMEKGLAAPAVVALLFQHLRRAVAERAVPGKGLIYRAAMAPSVIEKLLRERPRAWFADYDALLLRTFGDAVEEGRRMQGDRVEDWEYGRVNAIQIVHPVTGRIPTLTKYFNVGPAPVSGSPLTVKQITRTLGPSMRMVVDLGDWDHSIMNLVTGESGQILSGHYKDQWDTYAAGRSLPMPFVKIDAKRVLKVMPQR